MLEWDETILESNIENKNEKIIFCLIKNIELILKKKINFNSILNEELENDNESNSNNNLLSCNKKNSYFFMNKSYYLRSLNAMDEKSLIEVIYFKFKKNN